MNQQNYNNNTTKPRLNIWIIITATVTIIALIMGTCIYYWQNQFIKSIQNDSQKQIAELNNQLSKSQTLQNKLQQQISDLQSKILQIQTQKENSDMLPIEWRFYTSSSRGKTFSLNYPDDWDVGKTAGFFRKENKDGDKIAEFHIWGISNSDFGNSIDSIEKYVDNSFDYPYNYDDCEGPCARSRIGVLVKILGLNITNKEQILVAGNNSMKYELQNKQIKSITNLIYVPYNDQESVFVIELTDNTTSNQFKETLEKMLLSVKFD